MPAETKDDKNRAFAQVTQANSFTKVRILYAIVLLQYIGIFLYVFFAGTSDVGADYIVPGVVTVAFAVVYERSILFDFGRRPEVRVLLSNVLCTSKYGVIEH